MIAVIHQPNLFPRLKVLQKIALADVWIVLDDVQFAQREYQNRMLLVPDHGQCQPYWCTLPVTLPSGQATHIDDVLLVDKDPSKTIEKAALSFCFKATAEFRQDRERLLDSIRLTEPNLVDLGITTTVEMLRIAGFEPAIVRSSSYDVNVTNKSLRLVQLCKQAKATTYVSDSGGTNYLEEELFDQGDIDILWHIWHAPPGTRSLELGSQIRNCSGLNLLARSRQEFIETIASCSVSRQRCWSEGK